MLSMNMHWDQTEWSEEGSEVCLYPMEMCISHTHGLIRNFIKRNDK